MKYTLLLSFCVNCSTAAGEREEAKGEADSDLLRTKFGKNEQQTNE